MSAKTHHDPRTSHWADKYAGELADFSLNQEWLDFEAAIECVRQINDPALPSDVLDAIVQSADITAEVVRAQVPVSGQPVRDWNEIDTRNREVRFSKAESELFSLRELLTVSYAGVTDPSRRNEVTPGLSPATKMAVDNLVEATRACVYEFDAAIPAPLSSLWGVKPDRDREHAAWDTKMQTWQVFTTAANIHDPATLIRNVDRFILSLADENTSEVRLWVQCQSVTARELWESAWMVQKRQGGSLPPKMPDWARRERESGDIEQALTTGKSKPEIRVFKDDVLRDLYVLREWLVNQQQNEPADNAGEMGTKPTTGDKVSREVNSTEKGKAEATHRSKVESREQAKPTGDKPDKMKWEDAADRLERLRSQGEAFKSQGAYAEDFHYSRSTINKAIARTASLQSWAHSKSVPAPKAQSLNEVVTDNKPQQRETDPSDCMPDDDIDATLDRLVSEVEPEQQDKLREELDAMTTVARRELAFVTANDPYVGNRIFGRKA